MTTLCICEASSPLTFAAMYESQANNINTPECFLLQSVARLLTVVKWLKEYPPPTDKWDYLNGKVMEEIVHTVNWSMAFNWWSSKTSVWNKFMGFAKSSPPPCVHQIIQLITREWKDATDDKQNLIGVSCQMLTSRNHVKRSPLPTLLGTKISLWHISTHTLLSLCKRRGGGCFLVLSLLQCRQARIVCADVSLGLH